MPRPGAGTSNTDDLPEGRYPEIPMLGTGTRTASTPEEAEELYAQLPEGSRRDRLSLQRRQQDAEPHPFKPDWRDPETCKECGQPRPGHLDEDEDEDEYGPDGPKMPRLNDLPSYTIFGQILKRMG